MHDISMDPKELDIMLLCTVKREKKERRRARTKASQDFQENEKNVDEVPGIRINIWEKKVSSVSLGQLADVNNVPSSSQYAVTEPASTVFEV
ncbi:jg12547 [Pararge aegeria aegeria]|uniref:Jg12547 protein n=1 Tax=Pararge aegeria aegeria TaxID=348720 RepID=A0A8S4SCH7_9NEOP|nr:jg12547 [Pararge aegeria aegeria]